MRENRRYDLESLKEEFGLSEDQVRYRVTRIRPLLEKVGHPIRQGEHNKFFFDEEAFSIFRRAVELQRSGMTWHKALEVLQSEFQPYTLGELRAHYEKRIGELERRLEEIRQERNFLKEEITFLRRQNEDLRAMLRALVGGVEATPEPEQGSSGSGSGEGSSATREKPPTA
ncbi:MAG: hypothetical protein ACE5LQ_02520 [Candidatus Bipolaricaulia bacterium]